MLARLTLLLALLLFPTFATAEGGVVSAADPRAAEAGRAMLRAGGSAADAAMAMMLALSVVEPQSSGIGGGGFLVYHDAKTGGPATIDGRETAPASATATRFLLPDGMPMPFRQAVPGGLSVGVPGNVRLMAMAHAKWGKLPWPKLFEPAIALAENGYRVTPKLAGALAIVGGLWGDFPATAAIYFEDGKPKPVGATVRNPALAATLRHLAAEGPDAFYTGAIARSISDAVAQSKRNPSVLSLEDLAGYRAKERAPVCARYRVYRVCGMGPPSSGATTVLQILGMIERFDMRKLGKDNPVAWHLIAEAMQLAYADREKYLGDADFIDVPVAGLLDRKYLRQRSKLMSKKRSLAAYAAGQPPGAPSRTSGVSGEVSGTTHFVAIDGLGNVASMTSTVEGPFGSQIVASGMVLNNELTDFTFTPRKDGAPLANRVEAGKRPLSSMAPTIVYDASGKPIFAVGAAGGKRIIMQVTKALIARLDWGASAEQALALPNIYFGGGAVIVEEGTALAAMKPALEKLGHRVVVDDLMPSKANAAERIATGWRGAADPRSEGVALTE